MRNKCLQAKRRDEEKAKEIRRAYAQFIYIVTTECSYHSFNEFEAMVIY